MSARMEAIERFFVREIKGEPQIDAVTPRGGIKWPDQLFGRPLAFVGRHTRRIPEDPDLVGRVAFRAAAVVVLGATAVSVAAVWLENASHVSSSDVAQEQADSMWGTLAYDGRTAPRDLVIDKPVGSDFVSVLDADFADQDLYVLRGQKITNAVDLRGPEYLALLGDADNEQETTADGKKYGIYGRANVLVFAKVGDVFVPKGFGAVYIRTADMYRPLVENTSK